ncbi:MAG: adenine-specific DNA-methyltransferase [Nanoarchaeota archaeon]
MKEEGNLTDFENRISLVDVLNGLNKLPDNSIDLVFADPPYNIGKKFGEGKENGDKMAKEEYIEWCKKWIDECMRVLKPTGTFYFMGATQFINYLDSYVSNKYSVISRIVWYYDSSGVQAKKYFGSLYEPIIMVVKDKNNYKFNAENVMVEAKTGSKRKLIDYRKTPPQPYNTKKVMGNVWEIPRVRYLMDEYENHPTQKPEELMRRMIVASTNEGDIVLDPFSGSFTTCAVAKKLNRKFIGFDIEEKYIKMGLRRLGIAETFNGERLVKIKEKKTNNKSKKSHITNSQSQLT